MGSKPNRCLIRIRWANFLIILTLVLLAVIYVYLYGMWLPNTPDPFKSVMFVFKSSSTKRKHQLLHVAERPRFDAMSQSYDNDFHELNHVWFRMNCLRGLTHNIGIGNISIVIDAWRASYNPRCRDLFETFEDLFYIFTRSGPLVIPDTFAVKVLRWLGGRKELLEEARLQQITSVDNLYTQESTVFNPLRGQRPGADGGATQETKKFVADLVKNTAQDCDFCNYKTMTAEDPFGRVESQYSVAVSNTFKVERFHGLVIWKRHNPLNIKEHELLDAMQTAQKWFWQAHLWDKAYTIPHIYWDILPKASATQIHPHCHVTLARDQYYSRWNRLYFAAVQYALANRGGNYFTALFKIHLVLGLAFQFGNASVMAYLTPSATHEIVLISKVPCKDLFRLLYFCLAAFRDDMGLYALSAGMVFPKLVPSSNRNDLPTLIRIVYRGPAESMRADIDSLQLFGTVNVNVDPYMVISKIKQSIDRRSVDAHE